MLSIFIRTSMTPRAAAQVALAIMRRHYRRWHFSEDLLRRVCLCDGSVHLVSGEASMAEISEAKGGVLVEWRCRIGFAVRDALFDALPAALA